MRGEFERPARREEPTVEHSQRKAPGVGQLEAGTREHSQPVHLDRVVARGGVQERLGLHRKEGLRVGSE